MFHSQQAVQSRRLPLESPKPWLMFTVGTVALPLASMAATTERVSVLTPCVQALPGSNNRLPAMTPDGRFVAWQATCSAGSPCIYVRDRFMATTTLASVTTTGQPAWGFGPSISADGRYVAFASTNADLVPNDTNGKSDIFVRDLQSRMTIRVSVDSAGNQANGHSSASHGTACSADGRFVAFHSAATNLVPNDTNGYPDAFVHDRDADGNGVFDEPGGNNTTRVSVPNLADQGVLGIQANFGGSDELSAGSMSADGRFVVFTSRSTNLVLNGPFVDRMVFAHDRQTGSTIRLGGWAAWPVVSGNGRYAAFGEIYSLVPGDTNGTWDIYVYDLQTTVLSRVSVNSAGQQANSYSQYPTLNFDGRFVSFNSDASNLVNGDTNARFDTFLHDRQTGATVRVNVSNEGNQANDDGFGFHPPISANGLVVAFESLASNLVPNDSNGPGSDGNDAFVRDYSSAPIGDGDADGIPDPCDPCPLDATNDSDLDNLCFPNDNCPNVNNAGQEDSNGDGIGDACTYGACCIEEFKCTLETEAGCLAEGGVFHGNFTDCPPQNVTVVIEGGSVFTHRVGPPVSCLPVRSSAVVCTPGQPLFDPWVSPSHATMCHNFGAAGQAVPADFFDPGSDAFAGSVCLEGLSLGAPGFGEADTLIRRDADPFDPCALPSPATASVQIDVYALSLASTLPITVTYNGGTNPELWNVTVDLSSVAAPSGTLTAVKTHCNGGTYTSELYVQPRFTFHSTGDGDIRVLDTGLAGIPPVALTQSDPLPWVHRVHPSLPISTDACSDFHAGVEDQNQTTNCPSCQLYGDIEPNDFPLLGDCDLDVDDILRVLDGFIDPVVFPETDIEPCGGDGDVDVDDILAELAAFAGFNACPHPCSP